MPKRDRSEGLPRRSGLQEARAGGRSERYDYYVLLFLFVALIANVLVLLYLL